MILGKQGVKYGLIKRETKQPVLQKRLAAFGDDDSEDEGRDVVAEQVKKQAAKKKTDARVAKLHEAALAQDPNIFAYDDFVEEKKVQAAHPQVQAPRAQGSKYIQTIMDSQEGRKQEDDIRYERKLLKEREVDDHLYGDKPKFVTAAYKKKLEEEKKWKAEEALREEFENRNDVVKKGHMGDFYRNMMTNNVAMGTGDPGRALPVLSEEPSGRDQASPGERTDAAAAAPTAPSEAAAPSVPAATAGTQSTSPKPSRPSAVEAPASAAAPAPGERTGEARAEPAAASAAQAGGAAADSAAAAPAPAADTEPVISAAEKAAAARERYLARKRKAAGLG